MEGQGKAVKTPTAGLRTKKEMTLFSSWVHFFIVSHKVFVSIYSCPAGSLLGLLDQSVFERQEYTLNCSLTNIYLHLATIRVIKMLNETRKLAKTLEEHPSLNAQNKMLNLFFPWIHHCCLRLTFNRNQFRGLFKGVKWHLGKLKIKLVKRKEIIFLWKCSQIYSTCFNLCLDWIIHQLSCCSFFVSPLINPYWWVKCFRPVCLTDLWEAVCYWPDSACTLSTHTLAILCINLLGPNPC